MLSDLTPSRIASRSFQGRLLLVLVVFMAGLMLSSCDPDDDGYYYNSPLVGSWTLISDNSGAIGGYDQSQFDFYSDGSGWLGQYDNKGIWRTYSLTWETAGSTLYIYPNQWAETWSYTWSIRGGYLYLYDLDSGNTLEYMPN